MANGEITGTIYKIGETQTLGKEDKPFFKREFIVEEKTTKREKSYSELIKLHLTGNQTDVADNFAAGDPVNAKYYIKGSKWVNKEKQDVFFTELICYGLSFQDIQREKTLQAGRIF